MPLNATRVTAIPEEFDGPDAGTSLTIVGSVKTREVIWRIEAAGWYRVRQSGGHSIYRHLVRPGQLTVPVHPGKEVPAGTAARLLKTAGIE